MPQTICNRATPNLVVPHLIIRQPLPNGTAIVTQAVVDELDTARISPLYNRVIALEAWMESMIDTTLPEIVERIETLEGNSISARGLIIPWPSAAIPGGWKLCDGSELLIANYADLFAVIGTTFGGDGITTFNLPDLQKEFIRGYHADLGTLCDDFDDSTAAPVSATDIPTGNNTTSLSHKHTITAGAGDERLIAAGSHAHGSNETDMTTPPPHSHGGIGPGGTPGVTGSGGSHDHTGYTGYDPAHNHSLGSEGAPVSAWAGLQGTMLPYDGYYDTLDYTTPGDGRVYMLSRPNIWAHNDWFSADAPAHRHTISTEAVHTHGIGLNDSVEHKHTITLNSDGSHSHSGETVAAAPSNHIHNVSKTTGWDSETKPQGMLLNFIIRT